MIKILSVLVLATLVADAFGQRFIHPTYRPPPRRPVIIRTVRDVSDQPLWLYQGDIPRAPASGDHPVLPTTIDDVKLDPNRRYARDVNDQPLWLYQGDIPRAPASGDHPVLPTIIDDVKLDPNQRYARSVDSPSARRSGGGSRSTGNHDTGRTHPGYNRRNARDVEFTQRPGWPKPRPTVGPVRPFPRQQPLSPISKSPSRYLIASFTADDWRQDVKMLKLISVLLLLVCIDYALSQRFIRLTYRPPPRRYIIRRVRDVSDQEPLWLNQDSNHPRAPTSGDNPVLPPYIDDVKVYPNRRYARSVDSPSARRSRGSSSKSSRSHDTGRTHPGYNRRNA
ncbi:uncharacterized protein LOC123879087 [Maniola jurtina]|uniref:uncharacterized protein LOC123879087 n=1 Tax=Maniola jurtina TaxID=191418 RepID=UPI001E68A59A|nr:uncharacterized protein LOC123879087 [Maniola jurtina]